MANPSFVSNTKLPLTQKPTMSSEGANRPTYDDIFNIQNTIRILLVKFVEEAPIDGEAYERKDGGWVVAGSSVSVPWGNITGSIADQTDLSTLLASKIGDAPTDGITYGRNNGDWVPAGGGGGASSSERAASYTYPLPGLVTAGVAYNSAATNTVRAFLVKPFDLAGSKIRMTVTSTVTGRFRAALYRFNVATQAIGTLIQDLGELNITASGSIDKNVDFPTPIANVSEYCLLVLFISGTSLTNLLYANINGRDPNWILPLVAGLSVNPTIRYDGTLTYPVSGAPSTLPALTPNATLPSLAPLFIYQP